MNWEYEIVEKWIPSQVGEEAVATRMKNALNALGEEGWEAYASFIKGSGDGGTMVVLLKREKGKTHAEMMEEVRTPES